MLGAECLLSSCDRNTTITAVGGAAPSVEIVSVGRRERVEERGAASGWVASCGGEVISGAEALLWLSNRAVPLGESDVAPGFDADAAWGLVRCPAHPNPGVAGDVFAVYELGDPPQRVVDVVIARAYEATVLPTLLVGSSPGGDADHPWVTGLASWLWVEGWQTASASASLPGVSATVVASPSPDVDWALNTTDNLVSVACVGPGTNEGDGCSITPNLRGGGTVQLTVDWTYRVSCSPACSATLPTQRIETDRPVEVAEIRGVLTR